jgi:hypothetical protein
LSFHSEPGCVEKRTHCVVAAIPGAAFTDRHGNTVVVVPFVCLPSSISFCPPPTIRRFTDSRALSLLGYRPRVAR